MSKKTCFFIIFIIIIFTLIPTNPSFTVYANAMKNSAHRNFSEPKEQEVLIQQLKARIEILKKALDKFGGATPINTAQLWAEGVQKRNGALQYAVLCDNLKRNFEAEMNQNGNYAWVTGVSSPWVTKYEVTNIKKINDTTCEITVKFQWATSAGESEPTEKVLTIGIQNNKWCINNIK